ncbi:MAG: glycine cleavage system aminomethyltransferase GcvT [Spirochaetes bacterium]|nr:glycine cleavage system aminomethyltransferase GcvT [Spirochaetota bacterium]
MEPKNTPLYQEHVKLKALIAPFAGWNMPIHYGSILEDAKHTRSMVSIFDISHMGEFIIKEDPARSSLDRIISTPVIKMKNRRCKYGFLLNEEGEIIDDLITYRIADNEWMLVVNAANELTDFEAISRQISPEASFENISSSIVKIDVQGPRSLDVMKRIAGEGVKQLTYYGFQHFDFMGGSYIVSRTGYTGELGFEIYIDFVKGEELWKALLQHPDVKPAGLGARDILRLEMGLPLCGNEFTKDTTPVDAGMDRFLDMDKEFTGKRALLDRQKRGVSRRLIGFAVEGRRTPRHENRIVSGGGTVGFVTSGVFSPHVNRGIGMGYIDAALGAEGTTITIDSGKDVIHATVVPLPFLKNTSIKYTEV